MQGIEQVKHAANMLADFGREGDTYIVHAAEGETVIPLEVLEANPRMKQMIFQQMEDMGLDPQRYVVGSEFNSINPITGQPEFFFKKIFKKLKKVVKKVAPIALPILAPFLAPALPLAFSSGLGSLIGAKIAGASTKDALKGALLTGGIAGLGSLAGGKGFLATGKDVGIKGLFSKSAGTAQPSTQAMTSSGTGSSTGSSLSLDSVVDSTKDFGKKFIYDPAPNVMDATGATTGESFLEKYLSPTRTSLSQNAAVADAAKTATTSVEAANQALQAAGASPLSEAAKQKMITDQIVQASVGFEPAGALAKYGPLAGTAATVGIGAYSLMSDKPPTDENNDGVDDITGLQILEQDKESGSYMYGFDPKMFFGDNPYYQGYNFQNPTATSISNIVNAAEGGAIVGPGTGTSDSIPAMLSDGEFVMTANAVKGAGGGDRQKGAKRMYAMMKQYEGRS